MKRMTPEDQAAVEATKAAVLAHLGAKNPDRTMRKIGSLAHATPTMSQGQISNRATTSLLEAGLIQYVRCRWWLTADLRHMTQESQFAIASFRRLTGRQYPQLEAAFETLSPEALRDLVRLVHDIESEVRSARRDGAREPWRNGL